MIELRTMTRYDVPLGMRLKDQAGWNQTEADWRRFLDLEPDGCFVATGQGIPVGTVVAFVFGSIGWIAMALVDRRVRHQGIGTRLVERALEYLHARGVRTTRLDATAMGQPIYERLGFVAEYELHRLQGVAGASGCTAAEAKVHCPTPKQFVELLELDREVTATDRGRLIRALHQEAPDETRTFVADQDVCGYMTFRHGARAIQIGPGVALTEEAGRGLVADALSRCWDQPVLIDVPVENRAAIACVESHGLVLQRPFIRMRRGDPVDDDPTRLWASSGPEKG